MRVFPVLKPANWQGLSYGARAHVWLGSPELPEIIVAYGCYDGGLVSYVTNEASGYGDPDTLVKEAFDNLAARSFGLQAVGAGADQVAITAGPFTAEQVLCEQHMLRVHEALGTDEIVVSIARRDAFMACAADASPPLRRTMAGLHIEAWKGEMKAADRILDQLVVFRRGLKVETIPVGADTTGHPQWGQWAA